MRFIHTLSVAVGLVAVCVLAPTLRAQDGGGPFGGLQPHYWPHRTFGIPFNTDALAQQANKPTHLQLYYATTGGAFQKGPKLPLNGLHELNGGKKGFLFEATRDGDYEFAVQLIYADGTTTPKENQLGPEVRAVIDTVPPRVQIQSVGNGVEWLATDDNLDPRGISLECKWPNNANWTPVTKNGGYKANDTYAWQMKPGQVLEVRIVALDRSGNKGISPVVRVPGEQNSTVGLPKPGTHAWPENTGNALPQPRIDYVGTLDFNVDYTVQRMGRSGVQAAHLFVLKETGTWDRVDRYPVSLKGEDKGPHSLTLPYKAPREGTYGFYVIPESGAGKRADDPKKDDPAMVLVVVDTTKPFVQITGVQVKPGGTHGPIVEITWNAADANLMPQPVSLEWTTDLRAEKWNEIKYRLDNNLTSTTGRFSWEVPDEKIWKFYARIRAVDKAANVGEHIWGQDLKKNQQPVEIVVDLEKPQATIDRVRGGQSGGPPAPKPPEKVPDEKPSDLP